MGKANRERRAAKKRRAERRDAHQRSGAGRSGGGFGVDLRALLIVSAHAVGDLEGLPDELRHAVHQAAVERGPGGTGLVVDDLFCDCLGSAWEGGWQPAEVVREVRRRRGARPADLSRTAVAASHSTLPAPAPGPWADQLVELEAAEPWWGRGRDWLRPWALRQGTPWDEALITAVETLGVLMSLPVTETLLPPPSQWGRPTTATRRSVPAVEDAVLDKVRALLAKAESTDFDEEADALTAKAQELMARYAIDAALAQSGRTATPEIPSARRVAVDDPYASPKSRLLSVVASANNVRSVWDERHAWMTIIGFEGDLDAVTVLFTSLLMQASRSMLAKGRIRDAGGRSRTRSFRQSYLVAFGQRIHERLVLAAGQARATAERDFGRSLLPVLAGRREQVDELTARLFPDLVRARGSSVTNVDGWLAGRAAAEMATLGPIQPRLDGTHG